MKKNYKITLSNTLNEALSSNELTLLMLRIINVYLAYINPGDPSTATVEILLNEITTLFSVNINISDFDKALSKLQDFTLSIDNEVNSSPIPLFKICERSTDYYERDTIKLECSDEMLPHLFNLNNQFVTYKAWNVLFMTSIQAIRMYQILSQYKVAKKRTVELPELKRMLGIREESYPRVADFTHCILKKCQNLLSENTDIVFTYKILGRTKKWVEFTILKNPNRDFNFLKVSDRFEPDKEEENDSIFNISEEDVLFFNEACENKFNEFQIKALVTHSYNHVPFRGSLVDRRQRIYDYIERKYFKNVLKT